MAADESLNLLDTVMEEGWAQDGEPSIDDIDWESVRVLERDSAGNPTRIQAHGGASVGMTWRKTPAEDVPHGAVKVTVTVTDRYGGVLDKDAVVEAIVNGLDACGDGGWSVKVEDENNLWYDIHELKEGNNG